MYGAWDFAGDILMDATIASANGRMGQTNQRGTILDGPIHDTMWTQAGLFAVETALYRLLESWGVRPELVAEIAFSDLQVSVRYPGGFALRLARVKRYRDDKRAEDADTMESVRRIYAVQAGTN